MTKAEIVEVENGQPGWRHLYLEARAGADELHRWITWGAGKDGSSVEVRFPRAIVHSKPKLGIIQIDYEISRQDVQDIREKLSEEAANEFLHETRLRLDGMARLIAGASRITCEVTGETGAVMCVKDGWLRTLLPAVAQILGFAPLR